MAAKPKELTIAEKIENALILKGEGNERFKKQDYQAAIRKYHNALLHVKGLCDRSQTLQSFGAAFPDTGQQYPNEEDKKQITDLEFICYNNLAASLLKKQKYERALDYTNKALNIEPKNAKALFRRGTAYYHMRNFQDAEIDFRLVLELNPKETYVQKYLKEIESQKQKAVEKQKQMYSKMF